MWTLLLMFACGDFSRDDSGEAQGCTDPSHCELTVSAAAYECDGTDSGVTDDLVVTPTGPGTLDVLHIDFREGCCPEFSASAYSNRGAGEIEVSYILNPDPCDCECNLDLSYTLGDVPSGTWTLLAGFDAVEVTVE